MKAETAMQTELTHFDRARAELEKAASIDEVKAIRDKAEAMRLYARQALQSLEMQQRAAEIKIRAERKAGQLLSAMPKQHGARPADTGSHDVTPLSDIGITKMQSSRWQAVARVPDEVFEDYITRSIDTDRELTTAAVLRLSKGAIPPSPPLEQNDVDDDHIITTEFDALVGRNFGTVYADPPWKYANQSTRAATDNHYPTMSLNEICDLPVSDITANDAHLHLWTTNAFLFDAKDVMTAWGFEFRSVMLWIKPQMGIGNYWRVSHEFLLLGVRGNARRFADHSQMSWLAHERLQHSVKPDVFRDKVECVSPGPFVELFARRQSPGWSAWGNEIAAI